MTNEEFLKDVCPNHTENSKWNRSELLSILEKHKEAINYSQCCKELPSNKELHSAYNDAVLENHKTLDELNKEYIKLGFLYYHKYLQLKRMK